MKIIDAINQVDRLKPNMYGMQIKIQWLSRLDKRIFEEIFLTHVLSDEEKDPFLQEDGTDDSSSGDSTDDGSSDGSSDDSTDDTGTVAGNGWQRLELYGRPPEFEEEKLVFKGYTEDDTETELLVAEPYDEMYVHWLAAQIDWYNREYEGYNNENAMFEAEYSVFRNAFNRTHMPKTARKIYF